MRSLNSIAGVVAERFVRTAVRAASPRGKDVDLAAADEA